MFAILSISYKFICLTLKEILLLYAGMLSLIKLFKPIKICHALFPPETLKRGFESALQ